MQSHFFYAIMTNMDFFLYLCSKLFETAKANMKNNN